MPPLLLLIDHHNIYPHSVLIYSYFYGDSIQPGSIPGISEASRQLPGFLGYLYSTPQTRLALWGAVLLLISIPFSLVPNSPQAGWVTIILQVLAAIIAGFPIANRGMRALIYARQITIDLLMSIATLGALLIGETGEAATVVMLFAIGEALEGYTSERARRSLRSLLSLKPDVAHVVRPCLDCEEHMGQGGYSGGPCPFCGKHEITLPVDKLDIGDLVVVRPGERIPVDGHIYSGSSLVNQAPVTGESVRGSKIHGR